MEQAAHRKSFWLACSPSPIITSAPELPSTLSVERAAILLHCSVDGLIMNWLNQHERFDLAADAEALVQALIFSLQHNLGQP